MLSVQVGQGGDLRMGVDHPDDESAQRVTDVSYRLRSVQARVQAQQQVALDHRLDLRRADLWNEVVHPGARVHPSGWRLGNLPDLEQQHVCRVQPGDRG